MRVLVLAALACAGLSGCAETNNSAANYDADKAMMARNSGVSAGYSSATKRFGREVAAGMAWSNSGPVTPSADYGKLAQNYDQRRKKRLDH
ncbi:hypothetical protein [Labrys sp. ZIDIC5]|uniref:hypothetical protein n=1 Tax=Labrys sedimenti TaxID=3106036 RepID=UPI002ACA9477|nr:hypothetical protein [Labrys sp. ZIDIC5]MDZ5454070.1 hypothetical protein [Labrys sp. ZIDIC5]